MSGANEHGRASHIWKEELEAGKEKEVRFLIDGGATYTLLPKVAGNLKTKREHTFVLADGSKVKRKFSECYIILPQGEAHTPVILGEGNGALLGVVTLEILGLVTIQVCELRLTSSRLALSSI